MTDVEKVRKVK